MKEIKSTEQMEVVMSIYDMVDMKNDLTRIYHDLDDKASTNQLFWSMITNINMFLRCI